MNVRAANILDTRRVMSRVTNPMPKPGRPLAAVAEDTPGGRLRALRTLAGMKQEALADKLGVTRPMISKYERAGHEIPDYVVTRAVNLFGITASYLRYGDSSAHLARVRGRVGAGAEIEAIELPPWRYVEVPASWTDAVALEVAGTSCYPIYEDGDDLVIRGDQRLEESEFLNRMCVVETEGGQGLVKKVRRGSEASTYTLESPNSPPIENVRLTSARPVRLHIPR